MKLVKLSLVSILMSLILLSCGSDSSTDPDEEVDTPNGKVTIVTSVDGVEQDRRVIERKGDEFIPSNYSQQGYYVNANGLFSMIIVDTDDEFSANLVAVLNELKAGTYNFTDFDDQNFGSYRNSKYGSDQYIASSINLNITSVQYIGITELVGNYYITGTLNMELENEYNENPNVSVKLEFENMEILKGITGF